MAAFACAEAAASRCWDASWGGRRLGLARVVVKGLTDVFDRPPSALVVPRRFLGAGGPRAVAGVAAAVTLQLPARRRPGVGMVGDL